ncbi:MAG: thiol:disulfide interchange protein DsbA/DsbL [Gammaproteobacteria bacterium]|nr:thiol:disulfide interchange protein DsbA/DsbL [Gammaproteobacteria bacterium]
MNIRLLPQRLSLALLVLLVAPSAARSLGDSYEDVRPAQPTLTEGKIEVLEFFWYGCPHCYDFEPFLEKWQAAKPADVEFIRIPGVLNPQWVPHARAYYAAQKLGVLDRIHRPLFDALHKDREKVFTEEALQNFFESHGVAPKEFKRVYDSAEITTRVKQALVLAQNYRLEGVPAIIVNGKYRTALSLAGSYAGVIEVIDALVTREREANKQQ